MKVYSHPGLTGLEIWHGLSRHVPLYKLRDDKPAYFSGLADFLTQLHRGAAHTTSRNPLHAAAGFQHLILTGGEASHPLLAGCEFPAPIEILDPTPLAARRGAEAIWAEQNWRTPIAIDLGQTALKLHTASESRVFPRDEAHLPFGAFALEETAGRTRLRAFLAQALAGQEYDGAILGLPNALNLDGNAESSTYPGLYGPVELIFGGLFRSPVLIVNDAVLTARGWPPPPGRKTLVVTVGFGVGAAIWDL